MRLVPTPQVAGVLSGFDKRIFTNHFNFQPRFKVSESTSYFKSMLIIAGLTDFTNYFIGDAELMGYYP